MALLQANAILTAIDEVLTEELGAVRLVTDGTFRHGAHELDEPSAASGQLSVKPRVESQFTRIASSPARPPRQGSHTLYAIEVEVVSVREFSWIAALDPTKRRAVKAYAAADATLIAQALEWPGNTLQTALGAVTGLVSSQLKHAGSDIGKPEQLDDRTGLVRSVHFFEGTVKVETATS